MPIRKFKNLQSPHPFFRRKEEVPIDSHVKTTNLGRDVAQWCSEALGPRSDHPGFDSRSSGLLPISVPLSELTTVATKPLYKKEINVLTSWFKKPQNTLGLTGQIYS